jgi:hypothetical protein
MNLQKAAAFIIVVLLFYSAKTNAQDLTSIVPARFEQFCQKNHNEKLFVHTDKNFYLAGEIMWFKVYNVDAGNHQPVDASKIAYLEILDKENKPVMQAKIALKKGKGNGSFYLPVSINSGNYRLRAYTNWMKNFPAEWYFEKPVTIINSLKRLSVPAKDTVNHYYAAFFPEGGNLVKNVQSKIAFQVTDQYGKGIDCKGTLLTESNDTLLSFQSLKSGIGNFLFTPSSTQNYKAIISLPNGQTLSQNIPAVHEHGYVMHLQEEATGTIKITISGNAVPDQLVYLFVHSRQLMQVAEKQLLQNGMASFTIDKNKLADGLSNFTVFNSNQQPVCERLYFKKPAQVLNISATSNGSAYNSRKRVGLSVQTQITNIQQGVPANMSLAVYRLDSLQTVDANSILSYFWLSSELKGNIESPGYYFSNNSDEVNQAIDNLVLVHGWRRFTWHEVLNDKPVAFEYVPEFDGHIISCKVTNNITEKPADSISAWLSIPGIQLQFYNATTNNNGKASFDVRDYYGQNEIIIQTNAPDSNYRVDVLNPFSEKYTNHPLPAFVLQPATQAELSEHNISMQVLNTYEAGKLSQFAIPAIDTVPFYGKPFKKYSLDDYTRFTTMEEVLREYVPEVAVRRYGGQLHLKVFDWDVKDFYSTDPLILLDGIKVSNQIIMNYDPLKVNRLDVVTNRYIKGEFVYEGIVNFTTYHGDRQDLKLDSRAVILDYEGLQLKREFYSPVYKTEQQAASRLPDFRNLLYWQPDIQTDSTGQAAVEFYTSDIKGKYVAVLQGIDDKGHAGSYYFTFEVSDK